MTNLVNGQTSRMVQCKGSCLGSTVVPCEPAMKGPSRTNSAGGSFQFAISVRYFQANSRLTCASTECSNFKATPLGISNQPCRSADCGVLFGLFTEAEKISVAIFNIKVLAGPGSFLKWSNDMGSVRLQLME